MYPWQFGPLHYLVCKHGWRSEESTERGACFFTSICIHYLRRICTLFHSTIQSVFRSFSIQTYTDICAWWWPNLICNETILSSMPKVSIVGHMERKDIIYECVCTISPVMHAVIRWVVTIHSLGNNKLKQNKTMNKLFCKCWFYLVRWASALAAAIRRVVFGWPPGLGVTGHCKGHHVQLDWWNSRGTFHWKRAPIKRSFIAWLWRLYMQTHLPLSYRVRPTFRGMYLTQHLYGRESMWSFMSCSLTCLMHCST